MSRLAQRVQTLGATIFTTMTRLAQHHQAVNLGQGFPDFPAPPFLKEAAARAIAADLNQYAPANGRPRLRHAIAAAISRHYALDYDPEAEILVTHGATEGICAAILGLIDPGDEVILFEPTYDSYTPCVQFAGGVPRYYRLQPPAWEIDADRLAGLVSARTRLVVLNTPHNPCGKVYTPAELDILADLCQAHNLIALSDEVYEHLVFDGRPHIPLASRPEMRQRTLTLSSLGKSFSVTGWKVGWASGPADLIQAVFRTHQFMTFCGAAPFQEAAAEALGWAEESNYYAELNQAYTRRRDFLVQALQAAGLRPLTPQGTYFILADIAPLGFSDDVAFCQQLTTQAGVAAIPTSAFYHRPADAPPLARFAFCKSDATLTAAAERLQAWSQG